MCSPDSQAVFVWEVVDDLYGNDHFPLVLSLTLAGTPPLIPLQ